MTFEERAAAQSPPPGFHPIPGLDGFIAGNGPTFVRREGDGSVMFGCRIMPHMCNPSGVAHGGWIATLCDLALPLTARLTIPDLATRFGLTINLSIDYLRGPRLGEWVDCRARVLKRTGRLFFADGLLSVDDELVARGSGVFRIGPEARSIEIPGFH